jgi:hypothetical protein
MLQLISASKRKTESSPDLEIQIFLPPLSFHNQVHDVQLDNTRHDKNTPHSLLITMNIRTLSIYCRYDECRGARLTGEHKTKCGRTLKVVWAEFSTSTNVH